MQIIFKSIRIIDYQNERVYQRNIPDSFNEYINELITHINNNDKVRDFKTRSNTTEVIGSVLLILNNVEDDDFILQKNNGIANRLLRSEIEAQVQVTHMNISVKKGSLIQALLKNEATNTYSYLLAKVEHSDFVDDSDFSFKTGFSKNKKTIWKSCLIDLVDPNAEEFYVKVYTDTSGKFWTNSFLELDQMISDEVNTSNAFNAINEMLNRNIKKESKRDYTIIKNAFISYFKSNEHIDYLVMLDNVINNYQPEEIEQEKFAKFKEKLTRLPSDKNFDYQFSSVPSVIKSKITKTYKVYNGIELKITDAIDDLENTINAFEDNNGQWYIQIKTDDEETYKSFKKQS